MKAPAPGSGTAAQIAAGTFNVGASILNSLASPGGVAMLMGGGPAKVAGMVLAPILAKHAAENAMPTLGILRDPNATAQQKTEAALGEALSVAGAAAGARPLFKGPTVVPGPEEAAPVESPPAKSAKDSAAVFEGTAPEPSLNGGPSTAEQSAKVFQAQRMMDQYGRIDPATALALGRTGLGAAVGYYSGNTPEEKIRNATIGGLAALGAPRVLRLLRGEPDTMTDAAVQGATPPKQRARQPAQTQPRRRSAARRAPAFLKRGASWTMSKTHPSFHRKRRTW